MNKVIIEYSHPKFVNSYNLNRAIYSPNGKYIVAGSSNGALITWKPNGKAEIVEPGTAHNRALYSVAYNYSGTLAASGDESGTICLWD